MTIVMLQCKCETNLVLAVDTKNKKLTGYCPKCKLVWDIFDVNLSDVELGRVKASVRELSSKETDGMFCLRCTKILFGPSDPQENTSESFHQNHL